MEEEINKKLDNTIKVIEKVLEKHKDNPNVKEGYKEIKKFGNTPKK